MQSPKASISKHGSQGDQHFPGKIFEMFTASHSHVSKNYSFKLMLLNRSYD